MSVQKVSCPACGRRGQVAWEETPAPGYPHRPQLDDLSAGFVAVESNARDGQRILCAACRTPVKTE